MKLLFVLGGGGHSAQMLKLEKEFGCDKAYIVAGMNPMGIPSTATYKIGFRHSPTRWDDYLHILWHTWKIINKEKPDAVVSCGPSIALPVFLWARLKGIKTIFIETDCRVFSLSPTGRWIRRLHLASIFFGQYPDLVPRFPGTIYAGRIIG